MLLHKHITNTNIFKQYVHLYQCYETRSFTNVTLMLVIEYIQLWYYFVYIVIMCFDKNDSNNNNDS